MVEQLESGSADPELEQHVASEAIKEKEKQIEALQQESAALPANSDEQEAIAGEIEQLQATKESAEDMLAKAEATLKIQNAHRAKKARQEVAGRREQKKKEDSAAVKIQSIRRGNIARRQVSAEQSAPAVASAVVEMADAQITELQEEAEGLPVTSQRSKEIQEEIGELTKRRSSAANLVEQLESGIADPELEQHVASEAIKETEKQIEALQQESAALPANSDEQEAIADEIEQLHATKEHTCC